MNGEEHINVRLVWSEAKKRSEALEKCCSQFVAYKATLPGSGLDTCRFPTSVYRGRLNQFAAWAKAFRTERAPTQDFAERAQRFVCEVEAALMHIDSSRATPSRAASSWPASYDDHAKRQRDGVRAISDDSIDDEMEDVEDDGAVEEDDASEYQGSSDSSDSDSDSGRAHMGVHRGNTASRSAKPLCRHVGVLFPRKITPEVKAIQSFFIDFQRWRADLQRIDEQGLVRFWAHCFWALLDLPPTTLNLLDAHFQASLADPSTLNMALKYASTAGQLARKGKAQRSLVEKANATFILEVEQVALGAQKMRHRDQCKRHLTHARAEAAQLEAITCVNEEFCERLYEDPKTVAYLRWAQGLRDAHIDVTTVKALQQRLADTTQRLRNNMAATLTCSTAFEEKRLEASSNPHSRFNPGVERENIARVQEELNSATLTFRTNIKHLVERETQKCRDLKKQMDQLSDRMHPSATQPCAKPPSISDPKAYFAYKEPPPLQMAEDELFDLRRHWVRLRNELQQAECKLLSIGHTSGTSKASLKELVDRFTQKAVDVNPCVQLYSQQYASADAAHSTEMHRTHLGELDSLERALQAGSAPEPNKPPCRDAQIRRVQLAFSTGGPFAVLQLPRDQSGAGEQWRERVQKAYRELVKLVHPDRVQVHEPGDKTKAQRAFHAVDLAKNFLLNPDLVNRYKKEVPLLAYGTTLRDAAAASLCEELQCKMNAIGLAVQAVFDSFWSVPNGVCDSFCPPRKLWFTKSYPPAVELLDRLLELDLVAVHSLELANVNWERYAALLAAGTPHDRIGTAVGDSLFGYEQVPAPVVEKVDIAQGQQDAAGVLTLRVRGRIEEPSRGEEQASAPTEPADRGVKTTWLPEPHGLDPQRRSSAPDAARAGTPPSFFVRLPLGVAGWMMQTKQLRFPKLALLLRRSPHHYEALRAVRNDVQSLFAEHAPGKHPSSIKDCKAAPQPVTEPRFITTLAEFFRAADLLLNREHYEAPQGESENASKRPKK